MNALTALSAEDWKSLMALSDMQRVTPLLWHHLKQKGLDRVVPDAAASLLHESSRRNTLHNLRFNRELSLLLQALETEKIPLMPLKGIVLANKIYENIGLREMNDIDVLARPEDIMRIADILSGMGYRPIAPLCADVAIQTGIHLPRMIKKGHAGFEIHWNLTLPGKSYYIDPHELWMRAVPTQIAGCQTRVLSMEDALLYLCLHASYKHHFSFGLRPLCDINELIERFDNALDWDAVVDRACNQKWQRGVFMVLQLAVDIMKTTVPDAVLKRLRPADMSNAVLDAVRAQLFTDKSLTYSIPDSFAKILESRGLINKIKIISERVFVPKVLIANKYSIPENSIRIYGGYLHRFYDVLHLHGNTFKNIKQLHKENSTVKSLAARKKIIADWLEVE